jgi:hypothetical protein
MMIRASVNSSAWLFWLPAMFMLIMSAPAEPDFMVGSSSREPEPRKNILSRALEESAGGELSSAGFEGIRVEDIPRGDGQLEALKQGRHAMLEVDPAAYFLAREDTLRRAPESWQYDLLFQSVSSFQSPASGRGAIVCRFGSALEDIRDLRGRALGVLSRYQLDSGAVQISYLARSGLEPERDVRILQAQSPEDLCKALFTGLVQAVALPLGVVEEFLLHRAPERLRKEGVRTLYVSPPLPGSVWCIHRRLVRDRPDLVARLRLQLPAVLVDEIPLVAVNDGHYLTLPAMMEVLQ